ISPGSGNIATPVTISGTNFGTSGTVTFNGVSAPTSSWTATSISATVPVGATSGLVTVTTNGFTSNGVPFVVGAAPAITGVNPRGGTVRTAVTITVSYFGG